MYHAKVNGTTQFDLEWDGKSEEGKINGEVFSADMISTGQNKTHWILKNKILRGGSHRIEHGNQRSFGKSEWSCLSSTSQRSI